MNAVRREEYPSAASRLQLGIFPSEDSRSRISQSSPSKPSQMTGCEEPVGRRLRVATSELSTAGDSAASSAGAATEAGRAPADFSARPQETSNPNAAASA